MDTDFHKIFDIDSDKQINECRPICIGNKVWIGCRSTILKGIDIAEGNIIAANSLITGRCGKQNTIIGSKGLIRSGIRWEP